MIVYVDTSVMLRFLFREPRKLKEWGHWERGYASEIWGLEARRTIDRARLHKVLNDPSVGLAHLELRKMEGVLGRIRLTGVVVQRASGPMPTAVKTLDAIHLASALLLAERTKALVAFATHDHQQASAARALGFDVLGG